MQFQFFLHSNVKYNPQICGLLEVLHLILNKFKYIKSIEINAPKTLENEFFMELLIPKNCIICMFKWFCSNHWCSNSHVAFLKCTLKLQECRWHMCGDTSTRTCYRRWALTGAGHRALSDTRSWVLTSGHISPGSSSLG